MTSPKPGCLSRSANSPGGDLHKVAGMAPQSCHRGPLSKGNDMAYEIEDGIELPDAPGRRGRQRLYPFPDMEVGQSFFVPGGTPNTTNGSMQRWQKALGRKFTARSVDGGVRVWRIE